MRPLIFVWVGLVAGVGCQSEPGKKDAKMVLATEEAMPVDSSPAGEPRPDSIPKNIQVDSVIHLAFPPGGSPVTVKGYLDKRGDPVVCYLQVNRDTKLMAVLTPENEKADIRFSHIRRPDGKSDGPFSASMRYHLTEPGLYKLYIAPNKMAGDPVSTDFRLTVKIP
jgi:hypothetical protein